MCGICGWLAREGAPPTEAELSRMAATLVHRGPDESGVLLDGPVGLAIRRLRVIDPKSGRQPYATEDGQVAAVFNGEIYNFRPLRAELERKGHRFQGKADGEVIVHLYEEHGLDFVHHLNGMFAIALWDAGRQRLVLARDRLGIKPLFIARQGPLLLFASEPKAILASGRLKRSLDVISLDQYLTFEYVPGPRSIWEGVEKLPPGHLLVAEAGTVKVQRYWELRLEPGRTRLTPEEFLHNLGQSVKRMLVSDVPLGLFLSGGVDSSALAALMTEHAPGQVKTFSIGFEDDSYDESRYFREVARFLGTDHHDQILGPLNVENLLAPLVDVLDEPLADAAIVPTFLLSRFARQHVTVALAGEGADELLMGYPTYTAHRLARWLGWLPAWVKGLVHRLPVSHRYLSFDYKLKRFVSRLDEPLPRRHQLWMGSFGPEQKAALYRPEFRAYLGRDGLEALPTLERLGPMEQVQHLDLNFYLPDNLLVKLDRATMAVSLEGRVPFLDHTLVEQVAGLPTRVKLGKRILKQALPGRVPEAVLRRPKKGFGIPVAVWFRQSLRGFLGDRLEGLKRHGIFEPQALDTLFQEHQEGRVDRRKELWTLLMLSLWWERHLG